MLDVRVMRWFVCGYWINVRRMGTTLGMMKGGLRVEVGYSCIVALWEWNKLVACAFDDGEGN
jgi:hypothetical protein